MNNKKRLWIVIVIAALGSAMLAACGDKAPDSPTPVPSTSTPTAPPTPSASERMALGMDYREQGELDKAVAEFQQAIELDPDFVEAHYNLGLTHADRGEFDAAIAEYEKALELAPDLAEAHNGLGTVYFDTNRLDQALAKYTEAIQLDPDFADPYFNLGHVYLSMDRHAEALAAYLEADRLSPGDAETLHNIGVAYIKQGMVTEASVAWEQAIRINPDFGETRYTLGLAYNDLHRYGEAITQLNEALRLDPERTVAYKHLGVAYYATGQDDECIAAFETYLGLYPDDPNRDTMEAAIAELEHAAEATVGEYRNVEGGYGLVYPEDLYYAEEGMRSAFAKSQAVADIVLNTVLGEGTEDAIKESPVALLDVMPLTELAYSLRIEKNDRPEKFLQELAASIEAETSEPGSGMISRFPGAIAEISGYYGETAYSGMLVVVIVEDRVFTGAAMALPDQWDDFSPIFANMLTSISFFKQ